MFSWLQRNVLLRQLARSKLTGGERERKRDSTKVYQIRNFRLLPSTEKETNNHCQENHSHCNRHRNYRDLALVAGGSYCWEKKQKGRLRWKLPSSLSGAFSSSLLERNGGSLVEKKPLSERKWRGEIQCTGFRKIPSRKILQMVFHLLQVYMESTLSCSYKRLLDKTTFSSWDFLSLDVPPMTTPCFHT